MIDHEQLDLAVRHIVYLEKQYVRPMTWVNQVFYYLELCDIASDIERITHGKEPRYPRQAKHFD